MITLTVRGLEERSHLTVLTGGAGLVVALTARVLLGGAEVSASLPAALVFSGVLAVTAASMQCEFHRPRISALAWGIAGGATLVLLPLLYRRHGGVSLIPQPEAAWLLVVSAVAVTEEFLLRGTWFTAIQNRFDTATALLITTVAFALIHLPLYGPGAMPLDIAAGFFLGMLRLQSRSWTAPAIAHLLADIAAPWLI